MDTPTLQTLLQTHLSDILATGKLPLYQIKALEKFGSCRTAKLGGHTQYCENGHTSVWYNSCKHRSCPQCQNLAKAQWLENLQRILLDCPHHHVIFTLPSEFNDLWRYNRELMAGLLFKAAQETLHQFSKDPKFLGAVPGIISALHTWGRNLVLHPHLHVLISHGGLNADGDWVDPKKKILFPQKPVMMVFRGKFLSALKKKLSKEEVSLPSGRRLNHIQTLLNKLGRSEWVVHFCNRYVHGQGVAKYLAKYVKGGAFNNQQIKNIDGGRVKFLYKSHQTKKYEWLNLSASEFVARVVMHILPPGKCGVRYSGLYSSSARPKLGVARKALGQNELTEKVTIKWEDYLDELGHKPVCSQCQGVIIRVEEINYLKCA